MVVFDALCQTKGEVGASKQRVIESFYCIFKRTQRSQQNVLDYRRL